MFTKLLDEGGLSLDRLQSLCLVAQAGGVTRAAKADPARQSLYSRQIKELEQFFGAELMRRKGRGIGLTAAGERLNQLARECFASLLDFKCEYKGVPIEIVIGAGESLIEWVLMPHLAAVRDKLPNVRLKFLNLDTAEVVKRLADGVIDFGIVRKEAVSHPLEALQLGCVEYSLFVPGDLPPVGSAPRLFETLPLATLEGEGSFRTELSAIAQKNHLRLRIEVECTSFPLVARAVVTGHMGAILPSSAALDLMRFGVKEVRLAMLDSLKRQVCLAWSPRALTIRPALDQARTVFAQIFRNGTKP